MKEKNLTEEQKEGQGEVASSSIDMLRCYKIANKSLTVTTIILCCLNLYFGFSYAPIIILLMSDRISRAIYVLKHDVTKKHVVILIFWLAILTKSITAYVQMVA